MSPPPYHQCDLHMVLTQRYHMAKINLIIKGYKLRGQNSRSHRWQEPTLNPKRGHLKRTLMTPGSLKNRYLTFPTVGPLHTHLHDFTESREDLSSTTFDVTEGQPPASRPRIASPTPRKPSNAVDSLETAIDFVLALEHPCMAHIPYPAEPGGEEPANHMMLVCVP